MTSEQLTILTESSAFRLSKIIAHLSEAGVDIRAHCLVDNGDGHCKLRMVVTEPGKAIEILDREKIAAVLNDVVMVETEDKPGELTRMLQLFGDNDIQIEYSYTAASEKRGAAAMVFRFSDNAGAAEIFQKGCFKLL